ncbi:MAG: phosphate propanoyltransferase [Clostridia bacterium]
MKKIPIGVSNRHIHVSQKDLVKLFGKNYELNNYRDLGQPGQYACEESVELCGAKGCFPKVRILGPTRGDTQIEISLTDSYTLGIKNIPVRDSGDLEGTPGATIKGPNGSIELEKGVIIAKRHIHMTPEDAKEFGVSDKDYVQVETVDNDRQLIFKNVLVRVNDSYALEMHVDIDEANAAMLSNGDMVSIIK